MSLDLECHQSQCLVTIFSNVTIQSTVKYVIIYMVFLFILI